MTSKQRLNKLEQCVKPKKEIQVVYTDENGLFYTRANSGWVAEYGEKFTEAELNRRFPEDKYTIIVVEYVKDWRL
jgi:hypothetical protein